MTLTRVSHLILVLAASLNWWTFGAEVPLRDEARLVVGVFDEEFYADSFQQVTGGDLSFSSGFVSYNTANRSLVDALEEICLQTNIDYFFIMSSLATSHAVSQIAMVKGAPAFVYNTANGYHSMTKAAQTSVPGVYTLNGVLSNEGRAWAEVIHLSGWRYVNVIVQSSIRYDSLTDSLNSQYGRKHGGFINMLEVRQNQTPWELLIEYQRSLTYSTTKRKVLLTRLYYTSHDHFTTLRGFGDWVVSERYAYKRGFAITAYQLQTNMSMRLMLMSRSYLAYEIILIHADPEFTRQLINGADLIFHDKKIIWLVTSTAMSSELLSDHFTLLTLSDKLNSETALDFIHDVLKILDQKETTTPENQTRGCNGTIQPQQLERNYLQLEANNIVRGSSISYYKYTVRALFGVQGTTWVNITSIDLIHGEGFPTVTQALNDVPRKTNTVVTKVDKPFVMQSLPALFDGTEYCQTPTVPCLNISQDVIANHHYSSDITKLIFDDFFEGRKEPDRMYSLSCCQGLSIDLLKSLYADFEMDFQLYLAPDDQFGAFDLTTGNWSGLVKELIDDRADMVMGSFSITSPRSAVIDYSAPYYHSGFALLSISRPDTATNLVSFMEPFPLEVWPAIMAVCVVTFICQALVEWYSPRGINHSRETDKPTYSLSSAIKTIFSMICGHTIPTKMPESISAKIIQCFWGIFSIIYLANYTANLTSILADRTKITDVDNIYSDELLRLRTSSITNSAAEGYVKIIKPELYEKMREVEILTTQQGIDALRNDELDVFIHDTPVIDYIVSNENFDCLMRKLATFSVDSYGVAFPLGKQQDLQAAVTSKVLEYRSSGYIEKLRKTYFPRSTSSAACASANIPTLEGVKFTLAKASGLLLVLLIAMCLSSCLLLIEHAIYKFLIPYLKRLPPDSFWKSTSVLFVSQRIYRSISKDGNRGMQVFSEFANKIRSSTEEMKKTKQKAKLVFQFSFQKERQSRLTFHEVVKLAYMKKYNRPLMSTYQIRKLNQSQLIRCQRRSIESATMEMKERQALEDVIEEETLPNGSAITDHDSGHSSTLYDRDGAGLHITAQEMNCTPSAITAPETNCTRSAITAPETNCTQSASTAPEMNCTQSASTAPEMSCTRSAITAPEMNCTPSAITAPEMSCTPSAITAPEMNCIRSTILAAHDGSSNPNKVANHKTIGAITTLKAESDLTLDDYITSYDAVSHV